MESSGNVLVEGAVQIRVPVVATVIPKINSAGRLHLSVEEPHRAYHTTLSAGGKNELTIRELYFRY